MTQITLPQIDSKAAEIIAQLGASFTALQLSKKFDLTPEMLAIYIQLLSLGGYINYQTTDKIIVIDQNPEKRVRNLTDLILVTETTIKANSKKAQFDDAIIAEFKNTVAFMQQAQKDIIGTTE